MEQRKQIVRSFVSRGLHVIKAVGIAGISKSNYYYKSNGMPKGKKPSVVTSRDPGSVVSNEAVVADILNIISPEYHDYGYQVVTQKLRQRGYHINPKKVYRLMKKHQMLNPTVKKGEKINKEYVKYTTPLLESPFTTVEADIKYIYIHGENRNAYLLTFLCTFSRFAPVWELGYSMKAVHVVSLVKRFLQHPVVAQYASNNGLTVKIRTDNGPQFIAKLLADELEKANISHEFIKPGTPQQNGHIESFHSTVTRLVCKRNIFTDIDHARAVLIDFFTAYNYTRVMKCLLFYSPYEFLCLWINGIIEVKRNNKNKEFFFFRQKPPPIVRGCSWPEDIFGSFKNSIFNLSLPNPVVNSPV